MSAYKKGLEVLTAQEKRVLELVAKAQTNKEIALSLGISPSTVKRHLENIRRKLHLTNRVAVAVYAVRMGDCPLEIREIQETKRAA